VDRSREDDEVLLYAVCIVMSWIFWSALNMSGSSGCCSVSVLVVDASVGSNIFSVVAIDICMDVSASRMVETLESDSGGKLALASDVV
jgi:hypothetical protein